MKLRDIQSPRHVIGGRFSPNGELLALIGDDEAWLFRVNDGTLLWQTALPQFSTEEPRGLFESGAPVVVTTQAVITQYGPDSVGALSLTDGQPVWTSAPLGVIKDHTDPLRFALSSDGTAVAAFNSSTLRLLSTKTGAFLTQATSIPSLAIEARRVSPKQSTGGEHRIRDVTFGANGTLVVDTGLFRFQRQPPLTIARVKELLPELKAYTGISGDGNELVRELSDLHHLGMRPQAAAPANH